MSGYIVVFSVLFVLIITSILGYYFPESFIKFRGRNAVISKDNKYHQFSTNEGSEFKIDVAKYKQRKKIETIIVTLLTLALIILALVKNVLQ